MNELNHTNGKGDKERSPGWRKHYAEIDFHRGANPDGFVRRGSRLVKSYTPGRQVVFKFPEQADAQCVCIASLHLSGVRSCGARNPGEKQYLCTRPAGHTGDHVACGSRRHELATWKNAEESCGARNPIFEYRCTRPSGHDGSHRSTDFGGHVTSEWDGPYVSCADLDQADRHPAEPASDGKAREDHALAGLSQRVSQDMLAKGVKL